ncbi:MAG: hypothetical protein GX455_02455 [Phycisphaerae bacterium]|nr:hypothetical protein [Phycisphaerae bacterium]
MKIVLWTMIVALISMTYGCGNYACRQDITLGMDEQDALRTIPGIQVIAEEMNRKEYACDLLDTCPKSFLSSTTPYKLSFQNARLLRIEVNQDEITRRQLNHAVEMRYGYYRW